MVERVVRWSVRHARATIALTIVVGLLAVFAIPRIRIRLDARALLPADAPELAVSDELAAMFDRRDAVVVALVMETGTVYDVDAVARIERISTRLDQVPGIVRGSVVSLSTLPLLTLDEGVLEVAPLARPGASPSEIQARARKLEIEDAVLVSRDRRVAAVFADVDPSADRRELARAVRDLANDATTPGASVHVGGNALAQAELGYGAANDLLHLLPVMIVVLFGILWVSYRSKWVAIVSVLEIGVALLWVGGAMGITEQSIFVTTLVFPVVLLAIGVSDDVYAIDVWLSRWDGVPGESLETALASAFAESARPIAISTATTIVGLLSTVVSPLEPVRTFGLFGALAIGISTLFTFTFVPALLSLLGPRLQMWPRDLRRRARSRAALAISAPALRWPRRTGIAAMLICIAAFVLALGTRVNDSWVGNLPRAGSLRADTAILDSRLGGMTVLELVFERPGSTLTDPATFSALVALTERIREIDGVGAILSVADPMLRAFAQLDERTVSQLRASLRHGELLPAADLEQILLLVQSAAPTPLAQLLVPDRTRAQIRVFVRGADARQIGQLVASIQASASDATVTPFGDGWMSYLTVDLLVVGQLRSMALGGVLTLLLMFAVFRSVPLAIGAALPVVMSIVIVLAILAAAGISLGVASSLFVAIGLGIGADYALHLGDRYQRNARVLHRGAMRQAVAEVGPPILTGACAVSGSMLVLLGSASPPNQLLGLLVAICLVCAAVLTLIVLPALVCALERPR